MTRDGQSPAERLIELVGRFRGRRVALLADLVVDEFIHGDIERVSREAPVLILRQRRTETVPGGGGNAAANLRALGADPRPAGVVGRDGAGRRMIERFRELGLRTGAIIRHPGYETPTKSRVLAGGLHTRRQQIVRLDRGALPGRLPAAARRGLVERVRRTLARAEGLLVADYGYGCASPQVLRAVRAALPADAPVFVDSRSQVDRFRGVTACTPNQEELERALDCEPLKVEADLDAAGRRLLRRCGSRALLLTRGASGMVLFESRKRPLHIPAFGSDEVADVTGAGDTVIAAFTLAALAGANFAEAARLANYAAGIVVMKAGTATLTPDELIAAIREDIGS